MSSYFIFDCIIIGSGPAGYCAAIYAARADLKPIVYAGPEPGGQLIRTSEVDNYPGYPQGVSGSKLMEDLKKQAERFNALIKLETISKIDFSKNKGGIHILYAENHEEIHTKGVIIATGASPKYLGLESEERLKGKGVSACATCDGFFYKGKVVAIIGGGDTAVEEAIYLSKLCRRVYLLVRKNQLKASKAIQYHMKDIPNLEIHFHHEVIEVIGKKFVEGVRLVNNQNQKQKTLAIDGLFLAIGHYPNTEIFKNQLDLDRLGYIITEKSSTRTAIPGVFAAGDVQDPIYRQAITSAGSGCMAALDLERYLLYA